MVSWLPISRIYVYELSGIGGRPAAVCREHEALSTDILQQKPRRYWSAWLATLNWPTLKTGRSESVNAIANYWIRAIRIPPTVSFFQEFSLVQLPRFFAVNKNKESSLVDRALNLWWSWPTWVSTPSLNHERGNENIRRWPDSNRGRLQGRDAKTLA